MTDNQKDQPNNPESAERNILPEEALLKAEEKIKNLVFKEQPAQESFRQELKAKILSARQNAPMKFFTMKFMIPAIALAFVLAFATGGIYFKYTGNGGTIEMQDRRGRPPGQRGKPGNPGPGPGQRSAAPGDPDDRRGGRSPARSSEACDRNLPARTREDASRAGFGYH